MSAQKDAGDFQKYFTDDKRLFLEDPARLRWRRPWFFEYSIGPSYYYSTNLKVGKTIGIVLVLILVNGCRRLLVYEQALT